MTDDAPPWAVELGSKIDGLKRLLADNLPLLQSLQADEELAQRVARDAAKRAAQVERVVGEIPDALAEWRAKGGPRRSRGRGGSPRRTQRAQRG